MNCAETPRTNQTSAPLRTAQIAAQTGTAFELRFGEELVIVDRLGMQVADLFCFPKDDLRDGLSSGRTIDYNETIALTTGHVLHANSGRRLMRIIEDTCGRHDFLVTPCSLQMFQMIAKDTAHHPSCFENLATALSLYGIDAHQITTTLNVFMNVEVAPNGRISVLAPTSRAGDRMRLEAEVDLIVGLTACSDEGSNGGVCKPIDFEIWPSSASGQHIPRAGRVP
jgi:uncharacterized protein